MLIGGGERESCFSFSWVLGYGFVGFFLSHPISVPAKERKSRDESCLL